MDACCFSDLPPTSSQTTDDINQNETIKEYGDVPILTKRTSLNPESIKYIEQQQLLRHSAKISRLNIITNSIEQFVPHSDIDRIMKERIYSEKKITVTTLPLLVHRSN